MPHALPVVDLSGSIRLSLSKRPSRRELSEMQRAEPAYICNLALPFGISASYRAS